MNTMIMRLLEKFSRRRLNWAVAAAAIAFAFLWRAFLTPDVLFVMLLIVCMLYGLAVEFLKRFVPFLGLLLSYDALRGFVPTVNKYVHFATMIDFDRFLDKGSLPTQTLQHLLYHNHLAWYDFYFYGLYMLHFVIPVLIGVLIWRTRPQEYWRYVWSLVILSYAAFITFLVFPAAPPWMAAATGRIPGIEKLSTDIWYAVGVHNFPTLYAKFSPNAVAAVPSLHSAYPMMVVLFLWKLYGWKVGLPSLLYPLSIWVGVVYMGEHYVFDVIAGIIYAVLAYVLVGRAWKHRSKAEQLVRRLWPFGSPPVAQKGQRETFTS